MNTKWEHKDRDDLILKVLSGNASSEECRILKDGIKDSPEDRRYFEELRNIWLASEIVDRNASFDAGSGYDRFLSRVQSARRHKDGRLRLHIRLLQIAAVLAVVFLLGAFSYRYYNKQDALPVSYYETIVPLGAKSQIVLTDGTKVWLNAGSRLRYSTVFASRERDVFLEGEGYFEVAHNEKLPFEVKTSMLNVKAIGTSFNVKAYPGDSIVETILVEGKIVVSGIKGKNSDNIVLSPKQTLTLYKEQNSRRRSDQQASNSGIREELPIKNAVVTGESDVARATAWKNNKLIFVKERLGDVKVKMERWYGVKIEIKNPEIEDYLFTGTFEKETFEQAMTALSEAASCEFKIDKNVAVIIKK